LSGFCSDFNEFVDLSEELAKAVSKYSLLYCASVYLPA
jgi:hypothetical protein